MVYTLVRFIARISNIDMLITLINRYHFSKKSNLQHHIKWNYKKVSHNYL